MTAINIIMEKGPGPESQFIEIEDDDGQAIKVGVWSQMAPDPVDGEDGWWRLRIELPDSVELS